MHDIPQLDLGSLFSSEEAVAYVKLRPIETSKHGEEEEKVFGDACAVSAWEGKCLMNFTYYKRSPLKVPMTM
jgi:hypothetical protein